MSVLQQVIKDMYIDPELLEQLGEEQKQILFRKIREEQVRRWQVKDKEIESNPTKSTPRKINFLLGDDGEPWVWVMGEHKNDPSYDEIVRQRERAKQEEERKSELIEAEKLAKTEIMSLIKEFEQVGVRRRPASARAPSDSPDIGLIRTESQVSNLSDFTDSPQRPALRRRPKLTKRDSIIGDTAEERKKFKEEKMAEVLGTLRKTKSIAKKRAEEMAKKLEDTWRESQKKANLYDQNRRRSFKVARELTAKTPNIHEKIFDDLPSEKRKEIVQKLSVVKKPVRVAPAPPKKRMLKMSSFVQEDSTPKSTEHVIKWFKEVESPKGVGKESDGSISVWFHGKIGRDSAVKMLQSAPFGSYLVRLSAKLWGYTISVRTYEGCRHFLVDASSSQYNFLGPKQLKFKTLISLLDFYKTNPVTWDGKELLLLPVALDDDRDVYGGLYSGDEEDDEEDDGSLL